MGYTSHRPVRRSLHCAMCPARRRILYSVPSVQRLRFWRSAPISERQVKWTGRRQRTAAEAARIMRHLFGIQSKLSTPSSRVVSIIPR